MQAVTLSIPGEYWDSQIYSGKLYLFAENHSVHVYNWVRAVESVAKQFEPLQTAIRIAFVDGQLLYTDAGKLLLQDKEIRAVIQKQLNTLAETADLEINFKAGIGKFLKIRGNPFPFPHADSEIYYHKMFVGLKDGLFCTPTHALENEDSNGAEKRWDSSVLNVKASHQYTTLACAAGDEGLAEFSVFDPANSASTGTPKIVTPKSCTSCEWSYQSIFGSAPGTPGFLASFRKQKIAENQYERLIDRVVSSGEIFNATGVAWGCKDKIYNLNSDGLSVKLYNPKVGTAEAAGVSGTKIPEKQFLDKGVHGVGIDKITSPYDIVSTATAPFGSVVETHDGLQVIRSDETLEFIAGEPVSWRVFPRSENYANQLHIIYEDRIEIRTYMHDYFVDQQKKWAGIVR